MANTVLKEKRQLKPGCKPRWALGSTDAERLLKAQADLAEHKLAVQRGEFIAVREHEDREGMMADFYRKWALSLENDLGPRVAGLNEKEARVVIRKVARDHLARMSKL